MKSNESPADRLRLRLSLRSLLIWTIYAAIGMALGSASGPKVDPNLAAMGITLPNLSPFNALLGAASAAIAVGLVQQALEIRRQAANWPRSFASLRTGARWEAGLRCSLAATIIVCMTIQLLSMRQFLTFPEDDLFFYDDVVTQYLWWLAILIAIADASRRVIGSEPRPHRWLISGFIWFSLFGLTTYIVTDHFFIPYLTHLACKGVDGDAPLTFQRYPVTTRAEEWFLFLTTSGGAATISAAGGLSLRAMARYGLSGLRRPATLATLALLLGTSGSVCYWFYAITRNRLAPDLEDIGFGSSWWQQAGGIAMAAMLTTYVVYRGWRASASLPTTPED